MKNPLQTPKESLDQSGQEKVIPPAIGRSYQSHLEACLAGNKSAEVSDTFLDAVQRIGKAKIDFDTLTSQERDVLASVDVRWKMGPDGVKLWTPTARGSAKHTPDFEWLEKAAVEAWKKTHKEDGGRIPSWLKTWAGRWAQWGFRHASLIYDSARARATQNKTYNIALAATSTVAGPIRSLQVFLLEYLPVSLITQSTDRWPTPEDILSTSRTDAEAELLKDDFWNRCCVGIAERPLNPTSCARSQDVENFLVFISKTLCSESGALAESGSNPFDCPFEARYVRKNGQTRKSFTKRVGVGNPKYQRGSRYNDRLRAFVNGDKSAEVSVHFAREYGEIGKLPIDFSSLSGHEIIYFRHLDLRCEDGPDGVLLLAPSVPTGVKVGRSLDFIWLEEEAAIRWRKITQTPPPHWLTTWARQWAQWGHRYLSILYDGARRTFESRGATRPHQAAIISVTPIFESLQEFFLEYLPNSCLIKASGEWPPPEVLLAPVPHIPAAMQLRDDYWQVCASRHVRSSVNDRGKSRSLAVQKFLDFVASRLSIEKPHDYDGYSPKFVCPFLPRSTSGIHLVRKSDGSYKSPISRTGDKTCSWISRDFPQLCEWEPFAREYILSSKNRVAERLQNLSVIFEAYLARAGVVGTPGEHLDIKVAQHPLKLLLRENSFKVPRTLAEATTNQKVPRAAAEFLEHILRFHCSEIDEAGEIRLKEFHNPFRADLTPPSQAGRGQQFETLRQAMPYAWVKRMRLMLAEGPHFSDWKWAQQANTGTLSPDWFKVDRDLIDETDPDCVWRERTTGSPEKRNVETFYEMWSPVRWVALLTKLNTALRTFQVRMLDSGESDSYRFDLHTWALATDEGSSKDQPRDIWIKNNLAERNPKLALDVLARERIGNQKDERKSGVWSNGVLRREVVPSDSGWQIETLIYINSNKSADSRLSGAAKGFEIPLPMFPCPMELDGDLRWKRRQFSSDVERNHWLADLSENVHWWFAKLRDWQSKYNPVERRVEWKEFSGSTVMKEKSDVQYSMYRPACFLFREPSMGRSRAHPGPAFPLSENIVAAAWWHLNKQLESIFASEGRRNSDGSPIRLVKESGDSRRWTCEFDLHSIRVSLITALVVDGKVPIEIVQRLVGHSRILMTLYYTKISSIQMREQLSDGMRRLSENAVKTEIQFLQNATADRLRKEATYHDEESALAAIGASREPALRPVIAWVRVVGGICPVGAVTRNTEGGMHAGCFNGGELISHGVYGPVTGGERSCPNCRWFVTRPAFLSELASLFELAQYRARETDERALKAEAELQSAVDAEDAAHAQRASPEDMAIFRRAVEQAEARHAAISEQGITQKVTMGNTYRLIGRLLNVVNQSGDDENDDALVLSGGQAELCIFLEDTTSEMLQLARVSMHAEVFPEMDPGKAILKSSQIMARKLSQDGIDPWIMLNLSESEQCSLTNRVIRQIARVLSPEDDEVGLRRAARLIEGPESVADALGIKKSHLQDYLMSLSVDVEHPLKFGAVAGERSRLLGLNSEAAWAQKK